MENEKEIDYQAEYLKILEENKTLKERNDELFRVVVSFNGQKPIVNNPDNEQEQKTEKKIDIRDIKF